MTQPNQDKVGERIRGILKILIRNLYKAPDEDIINQALLQIKEVMKVKEEELALIILQHTHDGSSPKSIAHSICDYLKGRLG